MPKALLIAAAAMLLWAASMFIKLAEYDSRGEHVVIHVYSHYGWLPALLHEPHRVFSNGAAFFAIFLMAFVSLLHLALSVFLVWLLCYLFSILRPDAHNSTRCA